MGATTTAGSSTATTATLSREARRFLITNPTIGVNAARMKGLSDENQLTPTAWRLLHELLTRVKPGNSFDETMRDLATVLDVDYGTCRVAWKQLVLRDLLTPEVNIFGRIVGHRLSPALAYRGRPWKATIAQQQIDAQQQLVALAAPNAAINADESKPTGVFYRVADPYNMLQVYIPKIALEEGVRRALDFHRKAL